MARRSQIHTRVADGSLMPSAADIADLIDSLIGVEPAPLYASDIDRSGTSDADDIIRLVNQLHEGYYMMALPALP